MKRKKLSMNFTADGRTWKRSRVEQGDIAESNTSVAKAIFPKPLTQA
jgi:hypothetical protein